MPYCRFLSVAGIGFALETEQPLVENDCFAPFLTGNAAPDIHVHFREVSTLPAAPKHLLFSQMCLCVGEDESGRVRTWFREKPEDAAFYACSRGDIAAGCVWIDYLPTHRHCVSELRNCFFHIGLESILLHHDRLCLHASFVQTHLGGLLFSGVSGIGKSTQAALWCRCRNARQINGDRPILSREGQRWLAWGSPYAGSSDCHVNECYPIRAICLLEQAQECTLRRLTPAGAFRGIWPGLTVHGFDPEFVEKASDLAIDLATSVPVYRFACTPDEGAVTFLEQELGKEMTL